MKTIEAKKQVEAMKFNELVKAAKEAGIPVYQKSKEFLQHSLIKHMAPVPKVGRQQTIEVTDAMKEIIKDKELSKSDKMRKLYKKGMPMAQIARELDTYYSFVLGAVKRIEAPVVAEKAAA